MKFIYSSEEEKLRFVFGSNDVTHLTFFLKNAKATQEIVKNKVAVNLGDVLSFVAKAKYSEDFLIIDFPREQLLFATNVIAEYINWYKFSNNKISRAKDLKVILSIIRNVSKILN